MPIGVIKTIDLAVITYYYFYNIWVKGEVLATTAYLYTS